MANIRVPSQGFTPQGFGGRFAFLSLGFLVKGAGFRVSGLRFSSGFLARRSGGKECLGHFLLALAIFIAEFSG